MALSSRSTALLRPLVCSPRAFSTSTAALQRRERLLPRPIPPPPVIPAVVLRSPQPSAANATPITSSSDQTVEHRGTLSRAGEANEVLPSGAHLNMEYVQDGQASEGGYYQMTLLNPEYESALVEAGRVAVNRALEHWVREELNVMGTIRENTIEVFLGLLQHSSTLASILHTGLRIRPSTSLSVVPSGKAPFSLYLPSDASDEHLALAFQTYIGALATSLGPSPLPDLPHPKLSAYLIPLFHSALHHTTPADLLLQASKISGQARIGFKKGEPRAEIRVAQLGLWGARREKKLVKTLPEQVWHRTKGRVRKAEIMKQRWRMEEERMIPWRRRMVAISAHAQADAEAAQLYDARDEVLGDKWAADKARRKEEERAKLREEANASRGLGASTPPPSDSATSVAAAP